MPTLPVLFSVPRWFYNILEDVLGICKFLWTLILSFNHLYWWFNHMESDLCQYKQTNHIIGRNKTVTEEQTQQYRLFDKAFFFFSLPTEAAPPPSQQLHPHYREHMWNPPVPEECTSVKIPHNRSYTNTHFSSPLNTHTHTSHPVPFRSLLFERRQQRLFLLLVAED